MNYSSNLFDSDTLFTAPNIFSLICLILVFLCIIASTIFILYNLYMSRQKKINTTPHPKCLNYVN